MPRLVHRGNKTVTAIGWLILAGSLWGQAGPSAGYRYRRAITIDHTQVAYMDLTDFPVLISGSYSDLATVANGGKVFSGNGYDIVFTDASGTQVLTWETESYNPATGDVNFWVRVPSLSHTADTVIYLYYGNPAVTTFQGGAAGSAWDGDYLAVLHLSDNAASTTVRDSTANQGAWHNTTATSNTADSGQIGGGQTYGGQHTSGPYLAGTNGATQVTYSAWIRPVNLGDYGGVSETVIAKDIPGPQFLTLQTADWETARDMHW